MCYRVPMPAFLRACRAVLLCGGGLALGAGEPEPPVLDIPDDLWERVRAGTGFTGREIGFSDADFATVFKKDTAEKAFRHAAPGFLESFGDVRRLPGVACDLADRFAASPSRAGKAAIAHGLSGRQGPQVDGKREIPSAQALERLSPQKGWDRVPKGLQDLAVRILAASLDAAPRFRAASGEAFLKKHLPAEDPASVPFATLFDWVTAPYSFERDPRTIPPGSLDLLEAVDHSALASEALLLVGEIEEAVAQCRAWLAANPESAGPKKEVILETALGTIRIGSNGDDFHEGGDFLVIDPAGNDHYAGRTAASQGFARPVSLCIDFAGNDRYDAGYAPGSLACGFLGLGLLMDLAGNDFYRTGGAGLGCGIYGTGILFDEAGDDFYLTLDCLGEGAAVAGVGILDDRAGDDAYHARYLSQGFGGTLGTGLLLDSGGNDRYRATGWDGPNNPFKGNQPLSLSQGFSIGRRPETAPKKKEKVPPGAEKEPEDRPIARRGLAGGHGILVDVAGDDVYEAGVYSGGSAYWFGTGIFADLAGNDVYTRGTYSAGSSPHYGIGICVDRAGNDAYNTGNDRSRSSFGHGRDFGIGVFVDADGDDRYRLGTLCGGSVSVQAIGLFWDRAGNDAYDVVAGSERKADFPYALGNASVSAAEKGGAGHKDIRAAGIFLDTGGRDVYREVPPIDPDAPGFKPPEKPGHQGRDDADWRDAMGDVWIGYGLDVERFGSAVKGPAK